MAATQLLFLVIAISQVASFSLRDSFSKRFHNKRFLAKLARDPVTENLKFYVGRNKAEAKCTDDCTWTVAIFDDDKNLVETLPPKTWEEIDAMGSFIDIPASTVPVGFHRILQITTKTAEKVTCKAYDIPMDSEDSGETMFFSRMDECITVVPPPANGQAQNVPVPPPTPPTDVERVLRLLRKVLMQ